MNLAQSVQELKQIRLELNMAYHHGMYPVCRGKKKYKSKGAASSAGKILNTKPFKPYFCPYCYCWHIGRPVPRAEMEAIPMTTTWEEVFAFVEMMT